MAINEFGKQIKERIATAQFAMLRYETEITPCTGIKAVTIQERRHFTNGVMIAPWGSCIKREKPADDPLKNGKVRETGWELNVNGTKCNILATTDEFAPIIFLDVEGRFRGHETPYDTPPELPENNSIATLKRDTLYFGLAVDQLLNDAGVPNQQFIWGADWETVPALFLVRKRHIISLTLHNTFDECLENQAEEFNDSYRAFCAPRDGNGHKMPARTALQIGIEAADVVTTVNRGFAKGMRTEPFQREVMAKHLQELLEKVVGINNAAFITLSPELIELRKKLRSDFPTGRDELLRIKKESRAELPAMVKNKAEGKAIVVSMGRRVSQKQHDVLVESLRQILEEDTSFPVLAFFTTVHGDAGSPKRLERIKALETKYPSNVICEDGQLSYFEDLMAAADFNCMPSIYEPHGGAFDGTVIPIARAVDGLAEQICALRPKGNAARINAEWHTDNEEPTGFLYRENEEPNLYLYRENEEPLEQSLATQLQSLLDDSPSPDNSVFRTMRDSLKEVLKEAVDLRLKHEDEYARLVLAALEKQEGLSWQANLDGMLALVEQARKTRNVP